jgi:hypothetical protein
LLPQIFIDIGSVSILIQRINIFVPITKAIDDFLDKKVFLYSEKGYNAKDFL